MNRLPKAHMVKAWSWLVVLFQEGLETSGEASWMELVTGGVPSKATSCPTPLLTWVSSFALPYTPATMMLCPSDSLIAKEPAARSETCRDRETKIYLPCFKLSLLDISSDGSLIYPWDYFLRPPQTLPSILTSP